MDRLPILMVDGKIISTGLLGAWVARFAAAVKAGSRSGFYRELAELTETFVLRGKGRSGA